MKNKLTFAAIFFEKWVDERRKVINLDKILAERYSLLFRSLRFTLRDMRRKE